MARSGIEANFSLNLTHIKFKEIALDLIHVK